MLVLSKKQANEILEHLRSEVPNEGCGILAGKDGKIEKIYPMANTDKSPKSFFMEPKEQFNVMKDMRNAGLEMLAIYHSHPDTQAYPSVHDVNLASYAEVSYLIVSLKDDQNPVMRSFRIVEGEIEEEEFNIVDS